MKKTIDVTEQIIGLYEQDLIDNIRNKIDNDVYIGDEINLQRKVDQFMDFIEKDQNKSPKITPINFRDIQEKIVNKISEFIPLFGEFELLAAASEEPSNLKWYEHIITIGAVDGEGGFSLEINTRGKDSNEVKITISPQSGSEALLQKILAPYADQEIHISISNNGTSLLSAEMYVSPEADEAEGDGIIIDNSQPSEGKFKIDLIQNK